MIDFIIRGLLYAQVFFWFWFYDFEGITKYLSTRQFEIIFYGLGLVGFIFFRIIVPTFRFSHYSAFVLSQYCYMIMFAFYLFSDTMEYYKAASLACLTIFLNSFYWEMVLHVGVWNVGGFDFNQAVQLLHLIPAVWFVKRFKFDKDHAVRWLTRGFLFSFLISVIMLDGIQFDRMAWLPISIYNNQVLKANLYALNRMVCGGVLMAITKAAKEKPKYRNDVERVIDENEKVFKELAK